MLNHKRLLQIILVIAAACLVMAWVDAVLSPDYAVKSMLKIVLFLLLPGAFFWRDRQFTGGNLFRFNKKGLLLSLALGAGVYLFIVGAYFVIGPFFDFSNVTVTIQDRIGVNKDNFVFVALYISFINSLLEEFFFRGFGFLTLKKYASRRTAYLFSAGAFSLYHIAIMTNWFSPFLFVLLIAGLFGAGLLFNWLNEKNNNIYSSWMVHMCANFATNTIGFLLFGLL